MVLCFGIFAKILSCCRLDLPQEKFVSRIAWSVDKQNSSLASDLDFVVDNPEGMEGNKSLVSKLLSCKQSFVLRDKQLPSLEDARERFKSQVMPFIDDEKVANAVLAILYVISQDETIEIKHKEYFKRCLGMDKADVLRQARFDVPDFLTRILLYTIRVDNREGVQFAKDIADTFIEEAATKSWAEAKYDVDTQTVEVIQSVEKQLLDRIETLAEIQFFLVQDSYDSRHQLLDLKYDYLKNLGIDPEGLFPSQYYPVESIDLEKRLLITKKMSQISKLLKEFNRCLLEAQKLQDGQIITWPIHPGERLRELHKQFEELNEEIYSLIYTHKI